MRLTPQAKPSPSPVQEPRRSSAPEPLPGAPMDPAARLVPSVAALSLRSVRRAARRSQARPGHLALAPQPDGRTEPRRIPAPLGVGPSRQNVNRAARLLREQHGPLAQDPSRVAPMDRAPQPVPSAAVVSQQTSQANLHLGGKRLDSLTSEQRSSKKGGLGVAVLGE